MRESNKEEQGAEGGKSTGGGKNTDEKRKNGQIFGYIA